MHVPLTEPVSKMSVVESKSKAESETKENEPAVIESEGEEEEAQAASGTSAASAAKKKRKKKKKATSGDASGTTGDVQSAEKDAGKVPEKQTEPPSIPVRRFFPSGQYPEGELQDYKDE